MSPKNFFDLLKDSISQIVSGDEKEETSASEKQRKQAIQNEIESAIIVLAAEVMRISGNHTTETEKALFDFLEKNFGKRGSTKRSKQLSDHLFTGPRPFTKMACEELKSLTTHESKFEIIRLLYDLAAADDFVSVKENAAIHRIAAYLKVSGDELKAIKEKYSRANNPYAILEIEETASKTAIKAAYRKMTLRHHPDRTTGGISGDEANKRFREIKKAYEMIMKKIDG